jgi:hypothetical protein
MFFPLEVALTLSADVQNHKLCYYLYNIERSNTTVVDVRNTDTYLSLDFVKFCS